MARGSYSSISVGSLGGQDYDVIMQSLLTFCSPSMQRPYSACSAHLSLQATATRWGRDPMARGSYSSISVGSLGGQDYDVIMQSLLTFCSPSMQRPYSACSAHLSLQATATRWGRDPMARGSYSSISVGSLGGQDYDVIMQSLLTFCSPSMQRPYSACSAHLSLQATATRWGRDPMARGSYSSISVGSLGGQDYDVIMQSLLTFCSPSMQRPYSACSAHLSLQATATRWGRDPMARGSYSSISVGSLGGQDYDVIMQSLLTFCSPSMQRPYSACSAHLSLQATATRWGRDPMARGSYSSISVGSLGGQDYDVIMQSLLTFCSPSMQRPYSACSAHLSLQATATRWGRDPMARGSYSSISVGSLGGQDYDVIMQSLLTFCSPSMQQKVSRLCIMTS